LERTANGSSWKLRGIAGDGEPAGIGPMIGFCHRKLGPSWNGAGVEEQAGHEVGLIAHPAVL
jgi:hypothetical protein